MASSLVKSLARPSVWYSRNSVIGYLIDRCSVYEQSCVTAVALRSEQFQEFSNGKCDRRTYAVQASLQSEEASVPAWVPPPLEERPWQRHSRRSGVIAVKAGMTQTWDEWGVRIPLTVLWIDNCQVTQVKSKERGDVTDAVQVGIGTVRDKRRRGRATQLGTRKRVLHEFPVSPDALLPLGTEIRASHFAAGQRVDVAGTTIGKGFQGAMKRHGFGGGPASHGTSLAHRALGSTGACQDPGRVEKGKKMPGRMGGKRRTVMNAVVYKVDPARNLLYIRGAVPGHRGNFVFVRDAHSYRTSKSQSPAAEALPFPTFIGPEPTEPQTMRGGKDPFDPLPYPLSRSRFRPPAGVWGGGVSAPRRAMLLGAPHR
uniref:Large ribosomal subunit protein uL3m n=1 Tax=Tetraselmis sp. GSL018 TaxID=582737 RepID=A0A061QP64_9CHLO